jgi:preprotein translocase subunit SecA
VWGLGGLHVLGTELHDSARIDRQLFGRCGRQGEPGTYQMIISLEDEIITDAFGGRLKWVIRYFSGRTGRIPGLVAWPIFWIAQAAAERRNSNIRRSLLRYDDNLEDLLAFTGRSE